MHLPATLRHGALGRRQVGLDGGCHFRKFVSDPICDRQLPGADADWDRSRNFTIRDAVRIFIMGFSMGHARSIYRPARNNRTFYDLGTESVDALDSEPHVNV